MSAYAKRRRKRRNAIAPPVASMGDIAFLLIIFFMICSNFAKEANIEAEPPRSPDLELLERSMISVSIDKDGVIYLNGKKVPDSDAVEYGVNALIGDKAEVKQRTVMFKCDYKVDRRIYEPVLDAIATGGGIIAAQGERGLPK